jgi:hypothetical protein
METFIVLFFCRKSTLHQKDTMNEEHKIIRYKYILNSTKIVVWGQIQSPLSDPRVHYRVYKIWSLYPVPSQMNPVQLQNTHQTVNAVYGNNSYFVDYTEHRSDCADRMQNSRWCKREKDFSESQHNCLCVLTLLLGWHVSALLLGHLQITRYMRRRNYTL